MEQSARLDIISSNFIKYFKIITFDLSETPNGFSALSKSLYGSEDLWDKVRKKMALELVDNEEYYHRYLERFRDRRLMRYDRIKKRLDSFMDPDDYDNCFDSNSMIKIASNAFCRPILFFSGKDSLHILPCRISIGAWSEPICIHDNGEKYCDLLVPVATIEKPLKVLPPSDIENFWDSFAETRTEKNDLYNYFNNSVFYSSVEMVPPKIHCKFKDSALNQTSFIKKGCK